MIKHLKSRSYYEDFYDEITVDDCRLTEKRIKGSAAKRLKENNGPEERLKYEWSKAFLGIALYCKTGEAYLNKDKKINEWIERDRQRDELLENARIPKAYCLKCGRKMDYVFKDVMYSFDDKPKRVVFFFRCIPCKDGRGIYQNGEEYAMENTGEDDDGDIDYEIQEKKIDKYFAKDKKRFCLSKEEGQKYLGTKLNLKSMQELLDKEKEKKKNKKLYDRLKKIKKLTAFELDKYLSKRLEKNNYTKLETSSPETGRYVTLHFSAQDTQKDRHEYDSRMNLKKLINKLLLNTNWRLMSGGINYRLGILKGRLRGYDDEEDLIDLLKTKYDKSKIKRNL